MDKLIKYSKFIALLFLLLIFGCNDFQNNSFNIVFGTSIIGSFEQENKISGIKRYIFFG